MTATITNYTVDYQGNVTFQNPGTPANPLLTCTLRDGTPVSGSYALQSPTVGSWVMASGFQTGDQAYMIRVAATSSGVSAAGPPFLASVPPAPVVSALNVATVNGSPQLQNTSGSQWVAKGVTVWPFSDNVTDTEGFATTEWSDIQTVLATMQANNVNAVRVRLLAGYYNSLSATAQEAYVAQVVQMLAYVKGIGAIMIPCLWDGTDAGPSSTYDYSGANLATSYTELYPLIEAVCAATGNDPDLIWDPVNEPNGITWAQWLPAIEGLVGCLRTSGYSGPIVADAINWANSGSQGLGFSDSYYTQLEEYDASLLGGHHQIVFSCHQYWSPSWSGLTQGSTGGWSSTTFQNTVLGATTTHCVMVSEIGYDNNAPGNSSSAWSTAAMADLSTLSASMPNFAGTIGFLQDWIDDNTLVSLTDRQTLTAWGDIYFGVTPPPPPPAVSEVSPPTVAGTYQVGDTLTATPGVFANAVSTSGQWYNNPSNEQGVWSFYTPIAGQTGLTYTIQESDLGLEVTYAETATGAAGDTVTGHAWGLTTVTAAPPPPSAPTVTNPVTQVSGTTVVVTADCSSDVTAATLQDGSSSPIAGTPSNGVLSWTLSNESVGTHTYTIAVANAAGLTASVTCSATVASPPPPVVSEDFAGWWCWGQNQGGPGGGTLMGPCTPPKTAWSDNFTTPVPAGTQSIPAKDDLWGTLQTASAAYYGLPALPAGVSGQAAMFEVTPAQVKNYALTGYGAVMAKLFAAFGTTLTSSPWYTKPANVSGTYGAWFYFPTGFEVPANKTDWINLFQFKQTTTTGQNDPMWWVNVSSYYWAQQTQSNTPWATSARPTKSTDPVMYLNCEGGPIVPMLYAVPTGQWFHLEAVVTQGSQIVFTVNGGAFSTAPNSHYPVGPDSSHPCQWIFGIGNYATFAGTIYAAGATYTP